MTPALISAIAGAIVGIGGFIFGIVKWKDAKNERKKAQEKETTESFVNNAIQNAIKPIQEQNNIQNKAIKDLNDKYTESIQELKNLIDDNERERLKAEVMMFVNKCRNHSILTMADFKHIHKVYERYHNLGGNGYITHEMEYIEEKERELEKELENK